MNIINPMDLSGKRIMVTGASSGIGRAAARIFSQLGANIVLLGRNAERLESARASLAGDDHSTCAFDLTAVNEIPALMKKIAKENGPFSGLFHSAGVGGIKMINILKEHDIDNIFSSSIKAALLLARGFCQKGVGEPEGGSLVFMSSASSLCGVAGMAVYAASKAAIDGAMRSLACELAPKGIRVNSIVAGAIKTEMHDGLAKTINDQELAAYEQKHLLGFGTSEDVAYAAAFLLSNAGRWITGTALIVDGGYCCP